MADHVVTLNDELKRFETVVDGHTAFLEYALANDRLVLIHTEVPAERRTRSRNRDRGSCARPRRASGGSRAHHARRVLVLQPATGRSACITTSPSRVLTPTPLARSRVTVE